MLVPLMIDPFTGKLLRVATNTVSNWLRSVTTMPLVSFPGDPAGGIPL